MNDELIARAAEHVFLASNGIDGTPIGVTLSKVTADVVASAEATAAICNEAAKAVLNSIRPGDRLAGDLVAKIDDGSSDPGRSRVWAVDARVTGYRTGVLPSARIDEIVLAGEVHLEMLDEKVAYLGIGENRFQILVEDGRLVVRAEDSSFDDAVASDPSAT